MITLKQISTMALKLLFLAMLYFPTLSSLSARDFKGNEYDKRIFSFNPGIVFSGSGDCWGFGHELSHMKTIGKRFYIRQNLASWLINGSSWIEGAFENQTGVDISQEIGITPFKMNKRSISVSGGVCLTYLMYTSSSGGGSSYTYINNEQVSYVSNYEQKYYKAFDYGITFGINYHTKVSDAIYLNYRAAFRSGFVDGAAISIISIGLGFDAKKIFKQ